jgi:serine/threonine protein kinase
MEKWLSHNIPEFGDETRESAKEKDNSNLLQQNSLRPGDVIDSRYRIVNLVKSGGMGSVYKAEDMCLNNRICAVKEMLDSFSTTEERRTGIDRFLSEIQVLESFNHPNIPKVTDHFFLEKPPARYYYFIMEYIDSIDLSTYLKKYGNPGLPEKQVIQWAIQVCEALEYLHSMDPPVAHRDIKSSNLLFRHDDRRILLIDFGIARVTNPGEGYWIGTPGYAPPEQQMGKPEPASDFYALAASMHELLTGKRPEDFFFPAFADMNIKVSDKLTDFIGCCLEFDPMDRPMNATEMKKELLDILGTQPDIGPLSADYLFDNVVQEFKRKRLDSILMSLINRYGNESETKHIPKYLDYCELVLSCPTRFRLIIKKDDRDRRIHFYEKQGILEMKELGSLNPVNSGETEQVHQFVNRFVKDYENFKGANWGGGEGFIGFSSLGNII